MRLIKMEQAVSLAASGQKAYMLVPINGCTMLQELFDAAGFCVCEREPEESKPKEEQKPEKTEKKPAKKKAKGLDRGKIVACYRAGWSLTKIADEMGCSASTVDYHLKQEGLKG